MKRVLITITVLILAGMLLLAGFLLGLHHVLPSSASSGHAASDHGKSVLYWYDPMVPEEHFDKPGLSSMGMQTVPKYADEPASSDVVRIDSATVQNLGLRTAAVQRRALPSALQVSGTITWDLRQATTLSARTDGVVNTLYVRAPFTAVKAGEPVATLLSPQWNSAVAEYNALKRGQSYDAKALQSAARQRLAILGLSAADVQTASRNADGSIVLHAPATGVVTDLPIRQGQRVSAGQTLMSINGLSTVWIEAALPQALAGMVRSGTPVMVAVDAQPGREFPGTVETLLPDVDAATRTQRARIVLANPDNALSPGMFATVHLTPAASKPVLAVPDEALVTTGHAARVIVALDHGSFRPVTVRTGRSSGGYTEILSGLADNERVVTSGQFLIDSEANLSGALERMKDQPAAASSTGAPMPGEQP